MFLCYSYNDNEEEGCRFEDRLSLSHLRVLETWFKKHRPPPVVKSPRDGGTFGTLAPSPRIEEREPGLLNRREFKQAIEEVLGTDVYATNLDTLFTKVWL